MWTLTVKAGIHVLECGSVVWCWVLYHTFFVSDGIFFCCGARSKRGHACMNAHSDGEQPSHTTFNMSSPSKRKMKVVATERAQAKAQGEGLSESSGEQSADESDDELGSPGHAAQRRQKKKARKAAKAVAKEAQRAREAQVQREMANLQRGGRAAQRGVMRA